MKKLNSIIQNIEADGDLTIPEICAENTSFSVITLDKGRNIGDTIIISLEETAMSIANHSQGGLSEQNRFDVVIYLWKWTILTKVGLNFQGPSRHLR